MSEHNPALQSKEEIVEHQEVDKNQTLALVKEVIRSNKFPASQFEDVWGVKNCEVDEQISQTVFTGIMEAKAVFEEGENVAHFLREQYADTLQGSDIIEIAYDLQAGSYIQNALQNNNEASAYCKEMAALITSRSDSISNLLDIGTGELTTLCQLVDLLPKGFVRNKIYAFDISWSRLSKGIEYARTYFPETASQIVPFVADLTKIPLPTSSMDIVISSHAVEPNRAQQDAVIAELLRVAKQRLFLFEPCYEINSLSGKQRMDFHDYIKDLPGSISAFGGSLSELIPMHHVVNPLNPTACFLVDVEKNDFSETVDFTVPGTDSRLFLKDGFLHSEDAGICFPILSGLPILRVKCGILSTAMVLDRNSPVKYDLTNT